MLHLAAKEDMYHIYLLKSKVNGTFYTGYSQDPDRRLTEHNNGRVYYTKRYAPWEIVYIESYTDEERAKERERKLKRHGSAYHGLLKRLGYK